MDTKQTYESMKVYESLLQLKMYCEKQEGCSKCVLRDGFDEWAECHFGEKPRDWKLDLFDNWLAFIDLV